MKRRLAPLLVAGLVFSAARATLAHEARPGFLDMRETGPKTYAFLWKKPAGGEVEIQIEIRWPRFAEALPAYAVGSLGAYWTIQRTAVLLGGLR